MWLRISLKQIIDMAYISILTTSSLSLGMSRQQVVPTYSIRFGLSRRKPMADLLRLCSSSSEKTRSLGLGAELRFDICTPLWKIW